MSSTHTEKSQKEVFGRAVRHFGEGEFRKAKQLFEEAAAGPAATVSESANMYVRMCDQRLGTAKPEVRTAEEHYNYGISLLNERKLDEAIQHFRSALSGDTKDTAADVHFALSLASGLSGQLAEARQHLEQAIAIDPRIRSLARNDADFQPLMQHSDLRRLLEDAG